MGSWEFYVDGTFGKIYIIQHQADQVAYLWCKTKEDKILLKICTVWEQVVRKYISCIFPYKLLYIIFFTAYTFLTQVFPCSLVSRNCSSTVFFLVTEAGGFCGGFSSLETAGGDTGVGIFICKINKYKIIWNLRFSLFLCKKPHHIKNILASAKITKDKIL